MSRPDYRINDLPPADADLIPIERDPITGRRSGFDRDRKHRHRDHRAESAGRPAPAPGRPRTARSPGTRRTWAITGAVAATAAVIVGIVLLTGGGSTTPQAAPAPTAVRTSDVADTAVAGSGIGTIPATAVVAGADANPSVPSTAGLSQQNTAVHSTATGPNSPGGVAPPHTTASTSATNAPAGPAYLDPDRLLGYQEISTLDVSRMETVRNDQGSVQRWDLSCVKGGCELVDPAAKFTVGEQRISSKKSFSGGSPASACLPWTQTLSLTLDPTTGIYLGTYTEIPRAEKAGNCSASVRKSSIKLIPITKPDLGSVPADTPAALNPTRIAGYHGTSTSSGRAQPLIMNCTQGLCVLPCEPLCNGTVHVAAAAGTWTSDDVQPDFTTCGKGTTTISLTRSADGGYAGTVTGRYAGKVDVKKCPTSMTVELQPTLS